MRLGWVLAAVLGVGSAAAQENVGSITGKMVDTLDSYIPNATVTILSPLQMETKADSDGEFFLANLPPGEYKLRIQLPGFFSRNLGVSVEAGKEASLGHVVLEVKVPPCLGNAREPRISQTKRLRGDKSRVSGSTRGETSGALTGLTISLVVAGRSEIIASTGIGKNGEFAFEDVDPGIYDLVVSYESETLTKVRNLRVTKGHASEVRLSWTQSPGQICL